MTPDFLKRVAALEPLVWLPKVQAKKFRLDSKLFDSDSPKAAKEKLRGAAPAGASLRQYKDMAEFKARMVKICNGSSASFNPERRRSSSPKTVGPGLALDSSRRRSTPLHYFYFHLSSPSTIEI